MQASVTVPAYSPLGSIAMHQPKAQYYREQAERCLYLVKHATSADGRFILREVARQYQKLAERAQSGDHDDFPLLKLD
jgi:hypothetical protein